MFVFVFCRCYSDCVGLILIGGGAESFFLVQTVESDTRLFTGVRGRVLLEFPGEAERARDDDQQFLQSHPAKSRGVGGLAS